MTTDWIQISIEDSDSSTTMNSDGIVDLFIPEIIYDKVIVAAAELPEDDPLIATIGTDAVFSSPISIVWALFFVHQLREFDSLKLDITEVYNKPEITDVIEEVCYEFAKLFRIGGEDQELMNLPKTEAEDLTQVITADSRTFEASIPFITKLIGDSPDILEDLESFVKIRPIIQKLK